jgi:mRNA interferase RelE/StbE
MENYRIFFRKSAVKELESIPSVQMKKMISRINSLAENPRPQGSRKLSTEERYRLRQGSYRIVYSVSDEERSVTITKIGRRREIYRR